MRLFSDAASSVADPFLRRAFTLAENGRGTTSPNPLVGCVIVRDGEVAGEGWHVRAGEPHAEVNALAQAGERARGATAYVTLEPCNHTGRTGPCADALLSAGVSAVGIGMPDPNPGVEGAGAEKLRRAGVDVRFADDPSPFEQQNEAWLKSVRTGLPWVQAKVALTLDGCVALSPRTRSAITGSGGLEITRRVRSAADAVLVGASTAEIDDPSLTVRDIAGVADPRQPLRVVLARSAAPAATLRLLTDGAGPVALLLPAGDGTGDGAGDGAGDGTSAEALTPGVRALRYDADDGVTGALRALALDGVCHVLVEPGPGLFAALWAEDAIDELVLVTAGGIGGTSAVPLLGEAVEHDVERLETRMRAVEAGVAGEDAVTVWRRRNARPYETKREQDICSPD